MYAMKTLKINASNSLPSRAARSTAAPLPPRYVWLHECLLRDIKSGKYPVGSLLPTEAQLGKTFGVSRHTVREATRKLVDSGLISRRPSIGTIVMAGKQATPYVAALGSLDALMKYTNTTRLEVLGQARIKADAQLAQDLRCEIGSEWLELHTKRHLAGQDAPISFTKVYLRPEFAGIQNHLHGVRKPLVIGNLNLEADRKSEPGADVIKIIVTAHKHQTGDRHRSAQIHLNPLRTVLHGFNRTVISELR